MPDTAVTMPLNRISPLLDLIVQTGLERKISHPFFEIQYCYRISSLLDSHELFKRKLPVYWEYFNNELEFE